MISDLGERNQRLFDVKMISPLGDPETYLKANLLHSPPDEERPRQQPGVLPVQHRQGLHERVSRFLRLSGPLCAQVVETISSQPKAPPSLSESTWTATNFARR